MARFFRKRTELLGKRPGEMIFIGSSPYPKTEIHRIQYDQDELLESDGIDGLDNINRNNEKRQNWINIDGFGDKYSLTKIQENYSLHGLNMADILNTTLRPKSEEMKDSLFIALKMLTYDQEKEMVLSEQISLVLTGSSLLSFQERPGDVFNPVRKRLMENIGRIRSENVQYLAYSLMDCIVDNYISIMQILAEKIELTEDDMMGNPDESVLEMILSQKKELLFLSKTIRPVRDAIKSLIKDSDSPIQNEYKPYFSDLISNIIMVNESVELYKEICNEHLNQYNSYRNDRLNEIMKFLTIFSVIFLPLTLLSGIYGTNFNFIPELQWRYGYFLFLGSLGILSVIMVLIFKRKKWL